MKFFTTNILALNIILSIICSIYGYKSKNKLKEAKILILLPFLSVCQIFLAEIIKLITRSIHSIGTIEYMTVTVFIISEFIIILIFFRNLVKRSNTELIWIIILILSLGTLAIDIIYFINNHEANTFLFQIFESVTIECMSCLSLIRIFKTDKIENIYMRHTNLFTAGIFFGFIIIAPFSVLQKFMVTNTPKLYQLSVLANSLGYSIMFIFFILSIYVARKSTFI